MCFVLRQSAAMERAFSALSFFSTFAQAIRNAYGRFTKVAGKFMPVSICVASTL
jgi:hypothetical protein